MRSIAEETAETIPSGPPSKSPGQRQKILDLLRRAGPAGVDNFTLNQTCALRYTARISELRRQGHKIRTIREGEQRFRFVLVEPAQPAPFEDA